MNRNTRILVYTIVLVSTVVLILALNHFSVDFVNDEEIDANADQAPTDPEFVRLREERRAQDKSTWAEEVLAQEHEQTIVAYWDQMLRPSDDKFAVLASADFRSIALGSPGESKVVDWDIRRTDFEVPETVYTPKNWKALLQQMQAAGYVIEQIEFHQSSFFANPGGTAQSVFSTTLLVTNQDQSHRWIAKCNLEIDWTGKRDKAGNPRMGEIRVTDLYLLERPGEAAFSTAFEVKEMKARNFPIVYDIDRDGDDDILFPNADQVMRNEGNFIFNKELLFTAADTKAPWDVHAAVVSDFNGDGFADLLCTGYYETTEHQSAQSGQATLILFSGDEQGFFNSKGMPACESIIALEEPMCLTAGDMDNDGDLDIWLGQYKMPYMNGQMPTPFYDANDGHPSYLLVNEGKGDFVDRTEAAGIVKHRNRRSYSASFVDLDDDSDLDLLVVNDFAGIDLYYNDGASKFSEVTSDIVDEADNFGMGHTFADYNGDGILDFYIIGMSSTTMRRLNQMGLSREDFPEITTRRTTMGYGNRMYMGQGNGTYQQPEFKDAVARSGWSWGTTSLDFDSDGDMDLYVANGHSSGKTTKDYCSRYWCHDVYQGASYDNMAFFNVTRPAAMEGLSWDGYQKNHLFMNLDGKGFVNVAYLMGTASVRDSRSVVCADFNNDGRPDILVTAFGQKTSQAFTPATMTLYENNWSQPGNWITVRLQEDPGAPSPNGARICVRAGNRDYVGAIMTGDSYRSQHPPVKHFGLGKTKEVEYLEVRWPDGTTRRIENPAVNQTHLIRFGGQSTTLARHLPRGDQAFEEKH
jgi:hypothetical protein